MLSKSHERRDPVGAGSEVVNQSVLERSHDTTKRKGKGRGKAKATLVLIEAAREILAEFLGTWNGIISRPAGKYSGGPDDG